jgi:hypothetical protein
MNVVIELKATLEAKHAGRLIRDLSAGDAAGVTEITLDLRPMSFYEPLPLCIILATVRRWREKEGKKVEIKYYSNTNGGSYAERMDFFKHLGIEIKSANQRHDSKDNFITIRVIDHRTDEAALGREISSCLVKDMSGQQATDTMYLLEYLLGELIKNCMQHSRGLGYLHAQYFPSDGMFHVGIADDGVGVSGSYRLSESPRYKPGATEVHMLGEALTVESSSTTHRRDFQGKESPNYGVGLPMCRALTEDSAGLFAIYSGDAFVFDDYGKAAVAPMAPRKLGAPYGGVAVGLGFVRSAVGQTTFYQILNEVRIKLGLQKRDFSAERTGGFLS